MLVILDNDDDYQVCETTDEQPGRNSIGTPALTLTGDDEEDDYSLPFDFPFYGADYDEITVDTNGHVWLGGGADSDYDLDLPTGDGSNGDNFGTPLISAWNADLDSDSFGHGVRVQAFEEPNRVVVDFHTETHEDEGEDWLNRFQIVLYETGEIVFHYSYFNNDQDCYDDGSGISDGDDDQYIDLTDALDDPICDVGDGRSFMFEPLPAPVM